MRSMRWIAAICVCLVAGLASAQDAGVDADPQAAAFRHAIDSDPWTGTGAEEATDPLSRADTTALAAVTDDPDIATVEMPVPVRHGEIIEAISGVTERSHAIAITLEGGLAVVTETSTLTSTARHRAEVMLRLAVPDGAVISALHVENASGARDGVGTDAAETGYDDALYVRSTTPSARPVAHARVETDGEHTRLIVRAAPVGTGDPSDDDDGGALTVRVSWVVPTPMHGGALRLVVPARGSDARDASPEVSLEAIDVVEPRIDGASYEQGEADVRNDTGFVVTALAPISRGPRVDAATVPCGTGHCVVLRASGARAHVSSAPITIAIDASPSTTAGARGRIPDATRIVSVLLPASTPTRFIAFASRTEELGSGAPSSLDLPRVRAAIDSALGSATRFSALWAVLRDGVRAGDRVLVIGDGGITSDPSETAALEEARARGVVLSALDVADRPPMVTLASAATASGGLAIEAGAAAQRASSGHGDDELTERASITIAESVGPITAHVDGRAIDLGTLRTGENVLFVGAGARADIAMGDARATARAPDAAHATILSALASRQLVMIAVDASDVHHPSRCADATPRASSIVGHGLRIAPAHRRSCAEAVVATPPTSPMPGLPGRVIRDQLRRRVIPPARRCFRDDRMGRPDVHHDATFELVLADREVTSAAIIEGDVDDALSTCLLRAFDGIEVPSFRGTIVVRWPIHTEAVAPPPAIELAPDVAREVRAIAGEEPIPTAP